MSDEVASFKLDTGEEIIGRITSRNPHNNTIVISKPRALALMPGQAPGQMTIQLVPFMASDQDGDITVFDAHIVAQGKPASDLEKGYLQNTSGIEIAGSL